MQRWGNQFAGRQLLGVAAATVVAVSLQGCGIPEHSVGNWRAKPNYLKTYQFVPPGANASRVLLNSCEDLAMPSQVQCSGHGRCAEWFTATFEDSISMRHRLSFCECDQNWAGPECNMPRKSQVTAFMLALFLGFFGADQFYLGFWWPEGILKLLSFGGFGFWWIYDVVRIGSTPVLTADTFKLAADVSHWAFVLVVVSSMGFLGFVIGIWSITDQRVKKGRDMILLQEEGLDTSSFRPAPGREEGHVPTPQPHHQVPLAQPYAQKQMPRAHVPTPVPSNFNGYGSTLAAGVHVSTRPLPASRVFQTQ